VDRVPLTAQKIMAAAEKASELERFSTIHPNKTAVQ
jgi:hypothetical protein